MTAQPSDPIARGRAADIYAHGTDQILRRYRTPNFGVYEGAVMHHVASHGYPVPEVTEVCGPDMIMERLDGVTMLQDLMAHPWRLWRHARTLAGLLHRLHEIPTAPWMMPKLGGGDVVVHLDLHPDNVMITSRGPVVIDWSNAGAGSAPAEIGDLWLIMSNANPEVRGLKLLLVKGFRGLLVRALMKHFDMSEVRRHLRVAADHRLRDRNMTGEERTKIQAFVERWAL